MTRVGENSVDFQWPPELLCRAAQFGLENVVTRLLKFGGSLETAVTLHGSTPSHLAARHGHAKVVRVLLEKGAKLTALAEDGLTPLHIACKYGHPTVLGLLLDAHADCNAVDNDKTTALDFACRNGYHMVVKMLLTKPECGTDSNEQGKVSPLSVAIDRGFFDCAQFLLEKNACAEVQEIGNRTALCQAALNGHVALCQLLLKHGANSNVSIEEKPILCVVAESGNLEIVTLLVESGAEIDATDSRDQTSLQTASTKGHKALVAYLLDHGANIHHENIFGRTPIHDAACFRFTEIVQILIDSGADLQRPDLNGWTPLHLCYDLPEMARFLLENGANVNNV